MKKGLLLILMFVLAFVVSYFMALGVLWYKDHGSYRNFMFTSPVQGAEQIPCPSDAAVHPQEVQLSPVWTQVTALESADGVVGIFKTSSSGAATHSIIVMTGFPYPTLCVYLIDGNLRFLRLNGSASGYEWDTSVDLGVYQDIKLLFQDNFNPVPIIKPFHG